MNPLPASADAHAAQVGRALRLLVVEDSSDDYELLLVLLRKAGYAADAERVETEAEMRAALALREWDVVVSDHRLPRFSAQAALRTLQDAGLDIPFLIVSGAIGEDAAVEAMLTGADDFVMKNRLARLVPAIERSIGAAQTRRSRRDAEAALRDSEARLRAMAANLPGVLFEMRYPAPDQGPVLDFVSEGAAALFHVRAAALVADPGLLFRLISPEDRGGLRAALAAALQDSSTVHWEGRAYTDGPARELRWIRVSASPRRTGDGLALVWDGLMIDISPLKAVEAEVRASREELRSLSAHLEQMKETERARIAREIHDDIGGTLTGLKADLAWLRKRFGADAAVMEKLVGMAALVDSAVGASVRIARDLRPPILDFGFVAAVEWLAQDFQKRTGIACRLDCGVEELSLAPDKATAVFRIFQELLTNVTKHAQATEVRVRLEAAPAALVLEVADNGVGIAEDDRRKRDSYGIRGMAERARDLAGRLEIGGGPGNGARVRLEVPLDAGDAAPE